MNPIAWLLDLIYPPKCVFCGRLLKKNETDVCAKCRVALPEVVGSIERGEFFRCCWSVYYYEGFVAQSILRYKFGGMQQYADAYGRETAMLLLRSHVEFDVLTWVPVSDRRRRARGYDQSGLLAQAVASELGVPCTRTLRKKRDNPPQSRLRDHERRRANVLNAYEAVQEENFCGKRVLLIDDVITSGATLSECSRVLRTAGAAEVVCATLAAARNKDSR